MNTCLSLCVCKRTRASAYDVDDSFASAIHTVVPLNFSYGCVCVYAIRRAEADSHMEMFLFSVRLLFIEHLSGDRFDYVFIG